MEVVADTSAPALQRTVDVAAADAESDADEDAARQLSASTLAGLQAALSQLRGVAEANQEVLHEVEQELGISLASPAVA